MKGMRKQENGETDFLSNIRDGAIGGGTTHRNSQKSQTYRKSKCIPFRGQVTWWLLASVEVSKRSRVDCC